MAQQYNVTGMSCAACQLHVEKAVSKVPGVNACTVSLLTHSMSVDGSAAPAEIIKAVENAGYGASQMGQAAQTQTASQKLAEQEEALKDTETPKMIRRLIWSVAVLLVLMYFSMGHNMAGFPVPAAIDNPLALAIIEMLLALVVMYINRAFFINGFRGAIHGGANMDTLVAMGSGAAFAYSFVALLLATSMQAQTLMAFSMKHFYFESAAMIPTLITIGKTLESYSKGRTTDALKSLMKLAPKTAVVERDGVQTEVPIDDVATGDIFVVKPGQAIPVDGVIIEGTTAVNEAALTGESLPVDKAAGDAVSAATVNQSGFIRARATRVGQDTTLSQIIQMVSDAAATKAPLARIADKVAGVFVPAVILVALATCVGWILAGQTFSFAFTRAVAVLVVSCPCALGLATPVAIMVANGMGAKNGILYKTAQSLEGCGRTQIVALDKTGTITNGTPRVTDILPADGIDAADLLRAAGALEAKSEHPLARAIMDRLDQEGLTAGQVALFQALPGHGLTAVLDGSPLFGGNEAFIRTVTDVPSHLADQAQDLASQGRTPLYFARGKEILGIIAVADTMKDEAPEAICQLRGMGIRVVMLTGDNEGTARAIGKAAGVDQVIAGVLPQGKYEVIGRLQQQGKVAMVGDGINDAPALTRADTGIAIGAGTDVAIDAADVVLMKSRLTDVPAAIRMSRAAIRNIHENLFWAFFYNVLCIPLAIGLYQALFGWHFEMSPVVGALAMSFSSVTVCLNALRLNLFNLHDPSHDRKARGAASAAQDPQVVAVTDAQASEDVKHIVNTMKNQEEDQMTKTMNIEGMMCGHCEATVKKALEALDGVTEATVSHEKNTAVVSMDKDVADEALKEAVEAKDYKVISIA